MPKWTPSTASVTQPSDLSANVLLIGFGRYGQIASQQLLENGYSLSIIENSTQAIFDLEPLSFKVHLTHGAAGNGTHGTLNAAPCHTGDTSRR
ncbi:hypothetical protein SOM61_00660 [Massilia sp. CFBP9012]|uniref:hypothetical protein n=1 Tax=Massilia sp. CFBP9012 TaxID=3096531 RepID=UPI002A6B57D8|nr:hypothetical protein [Massilia sp. CFBP9012]MDY0973454.1 hypothetical protein [Massilia sp. CFBP9012]